MIGTETLRDYGGVRSSLLHSHGGMGAGSTHKPFFASRAFFSRLSSMESPGAYFRYHQHQPSLIHELEREYPDLQQALRADKQNKLDTRIG
jgi:hypothetical protein